MADHSSSSKHGALEALTQLGNPLWTLTKGLQRLSAELRKRRRHGWEVQVSHDGVFRYGERHPTRARALEEADACRRELEEKGWNALRQGEDVNPIDPFQMFEWLIIHYREVAADPRFPSLSAYEQWHVLRERVRKSGDPNRRARLQTVDRLEDPLKAGLLQWLDGRLRES